MSEPKKKCFPFIPLKQLSEYGLRQIWNSKFKDKPFPKVRAFILKDEEFQRLLKQRQSHPSYRDTQFKEYGKIASNEMVEAFIFKSVDGFVICITEHSLLLECLEHELRHAYSWQ
jgi:hypothetical protein